MKASGLLLVMVAGLAVGPAAPPGVLAVPPPLFLTPLGGAGRVADRAKDGFHRGRPAAHGHRQGLNQTTCLWNAMNNLPSGFARVRRAAHSLESGSKTALKWRSAGGSEMIL